MRYKYEYQDYIDKDGNVIKNGILWKITEAKEGEKADNIEDGVIDNIPDSVVEIAGGGGLTDSINDTIASKFSLGDEEDERVSIRDTITKVVIPEKVKTIKAQAFRDFQSLREIEYQGEPHLETIEMNAFNGCKALENIIIPESVKRVMVDAFKGCESAKSLEVQGEETVMVLTTSSLPQALKRLILSGRVEEYTGPDKENEEHFLDMSKELTVWSKEIIWSEESPESYRRLDIKEIKLPKGIKEIGERAFRECSRIARNRIT